MYRLARVHAFRATVEDKPGGTAAKLKALASAGIHLEYIHSERTEGHPGQGDLYVVPRQVPHEMDLCKKHGFSEVHEPIIMRFEGDDRAGLGQRVTMEWEKAGINLHGLMMTAVAGKFVGYAHFDHAEDSNAAAHILTQIGAGDTH